MKKCSDCGMEKSDVGPKQIGVANEPDRRGAETQIMRFLCKDCHQTNWRKPKT